MQNRWKRIFTSSHLRGEVGFYAQRKIRVRGILRESECMESPPHPDLLPASGEKEKKGRPASPAQLLTSPFQTASPAPQPRDLAAHAREVWPARPAF